MGKQIAKFMVAMLALLIALLVIAFNATLGSETAGYIYGLYIGIFFQALTGFFILCAAVSPFYLVGYGLYRVLPVGPEKRRKQRLDPPLCDDPRLR